MKNSAHILSHLLHQPQFSKLSQYQCIQRIQALFPPHLQKMIRFGYIKNGILFFVFTHPGAKQEFNIIAESIKMPLKAHPPASCRAFNISDIKTYVSYDTDVPKASPVKMPEHYPERAKGSFANRISDPKLHNIIENIRRIIHDRTT